MTLHPRDFPITDEAVAEALNAFGAAEHVAGKITHSVRIEAAIQAFLKHEGFEVERLLPDPGSITQFFPQERLVSPWKPVPSSREGGES